MTMLSKINENTLILSLIPTGYFIWTLDFTGAILILFLLMCLDLFTGIRKAIYLNCLSSRIAVQKSVDKAFNYGTFLIVGYLINMFFLSLEPTGYAAKLLMSLIGEFIQYLFILFAGFLIGVEGWSILENLAEMGMPVPMKIISKWGKNVKSITCSEKIDNKCK